MTAEEYAAKLIPFIQENLLPKDSGITVDASTPLLELGVLDSLKTAILMNYIRGELGVVIPPEQLSSSNFASPGTIVTVIHDLAASNAG
ncbi:acyl carrier protein [Streptomyces lavenduligriseus]|uniref:ChlB2 n=1 Tax=Streptomyces antibioticus TaxID=1890 RepID=Q0R4P6_STRAT|nr:ChlB2 [Streptomyces antibioticus]WDM16884.1 acyl carrier protein [Streptomyces lavenduligriseus]